MTVGEKLKRERKRQNYELEDVANATKIGKMYLIALENDDLTSLPGGVYTRNFLRAYARYLKLDEDIITAEYHSQHDIKSQYVIQHEQAKKDNLSFLGQRRRAYTLLLVVLVILAIAAWFFSKTEAAKEWSFLRSGVTLPNSDSSQPAGSPSSSGDYITPSVEAGDGYGDETTSTELDNQPEVENNDDGNMPPLEERNIPADDFDNAKTETAADDAFEINTGDPETEVASSAESVDEDGPESASSFEDEPIEVGPPLTLPIQDMLDVVPVNVEDDGSSHELEDVFIIEALERVWVQVIVDGTIVTERNLRKGELRVYRYGALNQLRLGDGTLVALQSGAFFTPTLKAPHGEVITLRFSSGELESAVRQQFGGSE